MKEEEIIKTLIEELFKMDTMHHEYKDNNSEYVIDSQKEGNTLTIKVTLKENKDKEEFENWLKTIDDNLFGEVLDELSENYADLQELYDGPDYKVVIDSVKAKTNQIVARKIKELEKLLS